MANVALVPALAKTLLAIAWSDGALHAEEETTIKEVIGLLPSLSAQEWAVIELYMVAPVAAAERDGLIQQMLAHIRSAEDKQIALQAVDAMLNADGVVSPEEAAIRQHVHAAITAVNVSPLGRLRNAVGSVVQPPPAREQGLELWRTNPIFYILHMQSARPGSAQLEVAALAAGIMAQVVRITPAAGAAERPILIQALKQDWQLTSALAGQTADAALAVLRRNIDYHRISRELVPRTSEAQRVALLDTLFAVANAADNVAPGEIDEIRVIAERLNLTRQQFIAAKLKIPSTARGGL